MAHHRRWPLALALSLALLLVALIPVAITTLVAALRDVPQLKEQSAQRQLSLANTVKGEVARYFGVAARELGMIKKLLALNTGQKAPHSLLDAFVMSSNFYEAIYLCDASGRVVSIGLPVKAQGRRDNYLGQDYSLRTFYQQAAREVKPVWSDSFLSPVSGRMTVALAEPFGDGMLIGEVGVAPLPDFTRTLAEGNSATIMLVDRSDQLIAHSANLFANQQFSLSNLPVVKSARQGGDRELIAYELGGEPMIGSASQISGLDWLVVVGQNKAEAFAQVDGLWLRIWIAVLIGLICALFAAILAARMLAAAFARYADQAQVIGDGIYDVQVTESRVIELEALQINLQRMAEAIRQREEQMRSARDELAILNVTLEDRVEERTDELTRANEEMVQTLETLERTQSELHRSEKLAALGSMVAGIAHELNTPIGNALMAASTSDAEMQEFANNVKDGTLRRSALENFLERGRQSHQIVLRNLARSAELISSFKQVAVDQTSSQRRRFLLDEVVKEILISIKPSLGAVRVQITTQVAPDLWLDSFPGPLGQVLINLLNNSVIHGFAGLDKGCICVEATAVDTRTVEIVVTDDGLGIPPENLPRVFDPFYTTRLGQGGSGLGLHIVHAMVTDLLGGSIQVSSTPGNGARFVIKLPVTAPGDTLDVRSAT